MKHVDAVLSLVSGRITPPHAAIDATVGNGHDTFRLAAWFPEARIYGFEIQSQAIEKVQKRISPEDRERIHLFCASHDQLESFVPEPVGLILFNLGYLPGGDHRIHTQWETTKQALLASMNRLEPGGIIAVTAYPGSIRGRVEEIGLAAFTAKLDQKQYDVMRIAMHNQRNRPPVLYLITKK